MIRHQTTLQSFKAFLKKHWVFLILIVFFVLLRMPFFPDFVHFANDEARDAFIVEDIILGKGIPLQGPETSLGGAHLGPFFYYYLTPFFWLMGGDPSSGSIAIVVAGVFTLTLLYWFLSKVISVSAGAGAALFYTFSFWIAQYGTWSWNPHMMPLALTMVFVLLCALFYEERPGRVRMYVIGVGVSAGVAMSFHAQALWLVILAALFLYLFVAFSKRTLVKWFLIGFIPFQLPLLFYEISTRGENLRKIIQWFVEVREKVPFNERLYDGVKDFFIILEKTIWNPGSLALAGFLFFVPALLIVFRRPLSFRFLPRTKKGVLLWLSGVLFFLHLISFFAISEKKYLHFIESLFPVMAILFGLLYGELRSMEKSIRRAALGLAALFIILNGISFSEQAWFRKNNFMQEEFDITLKDLRSVVKKVDACSGRGVHLESIFPGHQRAFEYFLRKKDLKRDNPNAECSFIVGKKEQALGENYGRLSVLEK